MDMNEIILPEAWARPVGYSEGIVSMGNRWLHIAGQFGLRSGSRKVAAEDTFGAQWALALQRVCEIVVTAGGVVENLVSLRIYVTDLSEYRSSLAEVSGGYRESLGSHYPTITMVEVSRLLDPGAVVEIEAVAILTQK